MVEIQWDAVAAVGTVSATAVAAWASWGAGRIAKDDRRAAIAREQEERRVDRETSRFRDRLDRSLAALAALDEVLMIPSNFPEFYVARSHLSTALLAMDDCPECVRRLYAPRPDDGPRTQADTEAAWREIGVPIDLGDAEVCRRLLLKRIARDRRALEIVA